MFAVMNIQAIWCRSGPELACCFIPQSSGQTVVGKEEKEHRKNKEIEPPSQKSDEQKENRPRGYAWRKSAHQAKPPIWKQPKLSIRNSHFLKLPGVYFYFFLIFFKLKNFFLLGYSRLISNVIEQRRDSAIYIRASILPQTPFIQVAI